MFDPHASPPEGHLYLRVLSPEFLPLKRLSRGKRVGSGHLATSTVKRSLRVARVRFECFAGSVLNILPVL